MNAETLIFLCICVIALFGFMNYKEQLKDKSLDNLSAFNEYDNLDFIENNSII